MTIEQSPYRGIPLDGSNTVDNINTRTKSEADLADREARAERWADLGVSTLFDASVMEGITPISDAAPVRGSTPRPRNPHHGHGGGGRINDFDSYSDPHYSGSPDTPFTEDDRRRNLDRVNQIRQSTDEQEKARIESLPIEEQPYARALLRARQDRRAARRSGRIR